jgi:hypothetical protein
MGLLVGVLAAAVVALAVALLVVGGDDEGEPEASAGSTATSESTSSVPEGGEGELEIVVSSAGVQSLGPFRPQSEGPAGAEEAYGLSQVTGPGGDTCEYRWPELGLTIFFAHFGGEDACAPDAGRVATVEIEDAAPASSRWVTAEGLRLDDDAAELELIYPGAFPVPRSEVFGLRQGQRAFSLFQTQVPFGETGSVNTLIATVSGGTVDGFRMYVGAAGE